MAETQEDQSEYEISMWGPTSSGKTSLMNSLMRSLYDRSQHDKFFDYLIYDADAEELQIDYSHLFTPPFDKDQSGTVSPETFRWVFQRRFKPTSKFVQPVSVHTHLIQIHDMAGVKAVALDDSLTKTIFSNSKFVLLMLDHTLLTEASAGQNIQTPWSTTGVTKQEYVASVEKFIRFLAESKPRETRWLAVCFVKVDLLSINRDPWQLINAHFGSNMTDLLTDCRNRLGWNVESFSVSSVGFVHKNGKRKSNFDLGKLEILDSENWAPYNVESPFFWMFNEIEKLRLKQHDSFISQWLFSDRNKEWVPYVYNRA
ncbi:MAG: hypothetical protein HOP27_00210 [Anaerolineales bacterium]|nr:hypothetical protein [Anaerolineales bacterium]